MRDFSTLVVVRVPREELFVIVRDRLPHLAKTLPDISAIDELERTSPEKGIVRVVNRWSVRQQVPSFLRKQLGTDKVSWLDFAEWRSDGLVCHWTIKPSVKGFEPAMGGRGTRVIFAGQLSIAPGVLSNIVGGFERPVIAFLETIGTTVIPANFRQVIQTAAQSASHGRLC